MIRLERITIKGSVQSSDPYSVLWILRALNSLVGNLKYLGRLLTVELLGISSLEVIRLVKDTDIIPDLRNTIVSCSSLVHIDLPFLFSELEGLSRERFCSLTGLGVILDRASYALVQSEIHDSNIRHLTLDSSIVQTFQPGLFIEAGIKSKIKSLRLLGDGFMFIDVADARPSDAFENLESVDINLPLFSFIPYSLLSSCSRLVVLKLQNCTDFNDSLFSIVLDTHYTLKEIALSNTGVTPLCLKFFNFSSASISHVLLHFSPSIVEPDFYYPIVEAAHLTHLDIKISCEHLKSLAPLLLHSPSLEVVKIHGTYSDQGSNNEAPSDFAPLDTLHSLTSQMVSCNSMTLRYLCLKLSFENENAKHHCSQGTSDILSDKVDDEITLLLESFPCLLSLHLCILALWDSDECFKPFVDTNRFPWALVQVE
ncbi:hypothetical protein DSO57_1002773 [Entomophthora muscae]|uniref:Uncharacterized protein n=1 Tax=Entomophthora muscae TaxID=34485 RepID=A0ACC2RNM9_9FUNG|nr:hypothetical protein DSO57_1002773 [Entomophthora muscae]